MHRHTIASWSGPRNISTAMLRSWGNRQDTFVCDEPLYAHYLQEHGLDHPGRDEILAQCETDAAKVTRWLTGPHPEGKAVFYQKHMAHHLIDTVPREWIEEVTSIFLIRDPKAMLVSLDKVVPNPDALDTGLPQQIALFRHLSERDGAPPPVIDSRDVLRDPRGTLTALCQALELPFDDDMLRWPPGRRSTDGVWAPHWYAAVEKSTEFAPYEEKHVELPPHLDEVHRQIAPAFDELYSARLVA